MSLLVAIVCAVLMVRRREKKSIVVLAVGCALATAWFAYMVMGLIHSLSEVKQAVGGVTPADKATILAAGVSEALNIAVFDGAVWLVLAAVIFGLDRVLRTRLVS